jgi:hypothetical protein
MDIWTNSSSLAPFNSFPKFFKLSSCTDCRAPIKDNNVVLPEPEGPVKMTISPVLIV